VTGEIERERRLLRRIPVGVRLGALTVTIVAVFAIILLTTSLSSEHIKEWMDGYGAAGPIVFVALSAALGCVFVPGPLLAGAAGLLFGTAAGTPLAVLSATLTAVIAFSISRWVAGDAVDRLAGDRIKGIAALAERRGFLSVLYIRLLPAMPYNLVNYAVGLTKIPLLAFVAATIIGTAPRTWAYVALGGSFGDFGNPTTIVALALIVLMGVGGVVSVVLTRPGLGRGSSSPDDRSADRP
jgi:uncharacterized membrane protein YdjX (TVP38/TMEM64 family)